MPNKYNDGRKLLKGLGYTPPNWLNHTIYGALEKRGYRWVAKHWTKLMPERDIQAGGKG